MSEPVACDHDNPGVTETIRSVSADQVHEFIEEPRAWELCRTLEYVQAVVAAWREFSSLPKASVDTK